MSILLNAYQGRSHAWDVTVVDAAGDPVVFETGDVFRVKIGRDGRVPKLDLDSVANTPNGSGCSASNPSRLTIHQDDLTFAPGAYDLEVDIVDKSDGSKIKAAEKGIFNLLATQSGDVGTS